MTKQEFREVAEDAGGLCEEVAEARESDEYRELCAFDPLCKAHIDAVLSALEDMGSYFKARLEGGAVNAE